MEKFELQRPISQLFNTINSQFCMCELFSDRLFQTIEKNPLISAKSFLLHHHFGNLLLIISIGHPNLQGQCMKAWNFREGTAGLALWGAVRHFLPTSYHVRFHFMACYFHGKLTLNILQQQQQQQQLLFTSTFGRNRFKYKSSFLRGGLQAIGPLQDLFPWPTHH